MADEGSPVKSACRVLEVTTAGFYEWRTRPLSSRAIRREWLADVIRDVHATSRGTYGAPRVHAELRLGRGIVVGHNLVARIMHRHGLVGLPARKRFRRPGVNITAVDLVERDFAREGPDQLWVTDITEHRTREGKLYCAVVLDTFSRRVVGWSIDASPTSVLVTNALSMAIQNRTPRAGSGLIIYSDQGTQFTSWAFTSRARESGLLPSMGSVGDCYDNAVDRVVLGTNADRAPQSPSLAHPC